MINLIFLFIHVYFCFNFITYANRYIIALIFLVVVFVVLVVVLLILLLRNGLSYSMRPRPLRKAVLSG